MKRKAFTNNNEERRKAGACNVCKSAAIVLSSVHDSTQGSIIFLILIFGEYNNFNILFYRKLIKKRK